MKTQAVQDTLDLIEDSVEEQYGLTSEDSIDVICYFLETLIKNLYGDPAVQVLQGLLTILED
jgi:hypothetical protein